MVQERENCQFHVHCAREMALDRWKNNGSFDFNNLEQHGIGDSIGNGGRGNIYREIAKASSEIILAIQLGDQNTIIGHIIRKVVG